MPPRGPPSPKRIHLDAKGALRRLNITSHMDCHWIAALDLLLKQVSELDLRAVIAQG